jgi:hypothetical protein
VPIIGEILQRLFKNINQTKKRLINHSFFLFQPTQILAICKESVGAIIVLR